MYSWLKVLFFFKTLRNTEINFLAILLVESICQTWNWKALKLDRGTQGMTIKPVRPFLLHGHGYVGIFVAFSLPHTEWSQTTESRDVNTDLSWCLLAKVHPYQHSCEQTSTLFASQSHFRAAEAVIFRHRKGQKFTARISFSIQSSTLFTSDEFLIARYIFLFVYVLCLQPSKAEQSHEGWNELAIIWHDVTKVFAV